MNRLLLEVSEKEDQIFAAFKDIIEELDATLYDVSADLAEKVIGEHDPLYTKLRVKIEAVLRQTMVDDDEDPIDSLKYLCGRAF